MHLEQRVIRIDGKDLMALVEAKMADEATAPYRAGVTRDISPIVQLERNGDGKRVTGFLARYTVREHVLIQIILDDAKIDCNRKLGADDVERPTINLEKLEASSYGLRGYAEVTAWVPRRDVAINT